MTHPCSRNEYDWCITHEVPFIPVGMEEVCSSQVGQTITSIADRPMTRLYVKLLETEENCENEHHSYDDCDHSECYSSYDIEEATSGMIAISEIRELVELIDDKRLTEVDLAMWRERLDMNPPPTSPIEWK